MALVDATWIGPYGYRMPDGTTLETGITVCKVPAAEAEGSDYWLPVKPVQTTVTTTPVASRSLGAGEDD